MRRKSVSGGSGALLPILAIMLIAGLAYITVEPEAVSEAASAADSEVAEVATEVRAAGTKPAQLCEMSRFSSVAERLRSLNEVQPKIVSAVSSARGDLPLLISRAHVGDGKSAIAALVMLKQCKPFGEYLEVGTLDVASNFSMTSNACKAVQPSMLVNPLQMLEASARGGSVEAKLLYALNAENIAKIVTLSSHPRKHEIAKDVLTNAETFGAEAASAGYEEAYVLMTRAHLQGTFGTIDPVKSYAYSLSLSRKNPSAEIHERLAYLAGNLKPREVEQAKELESRCSDYVSENVSINPFS